MDDEAIEANATAAARIHAVAGNLVFTGTPFAKLIMAYPSISPWH